MVVHQLPTLLLFLLLRVAVGLGPSPKVIQDIRAGLPSSQTTTITSALGWDDCKPHTVFSPTDTEHVADIVMNLHRDSTMSGQKYLVRATHQQFFSHNNLSCAAKADSSQHTVVLDLSQLTKILEFDDEDGTVTVQAGITFEALERALLEYELSLPGVVIVPHIGGMMVGAALVTGAHGSSLVGPATIGPFLTKAIIVDGTGEVHALELPGDLLEGSLGLLGIVTEVTITVTKAKKMAVRQLEAEDVEMVGDLRDIMQGSEALALDVTWSPTAGMYTARIWHKTEVESRGDAWNTALQAPRSWQDSMNDRLQRDQLDLRDAHGIMCEALGDITNQPHFQQTTFDESTPFDTAVGWLNHLGSTHCDGTAGSSDTGCLWHVAKWTPHEFAISSEDFSAWLADVKSVLEHVTGCPPFLLHFRFIGESEAPLSLSSGRQAVAVDMSSYSSKARGLPLKWQRLMDELTQLTMCKYNGRPHWALATNRMFTGPCPVRDMYGDAFDMFLETRLQYDPQDMLLPPLFKRIMGRQGPEYYPGCAIAHDCFCQEDAHCGLGHQCVPGYVFTEYNVCAPIFQSADEL